MSRFQISVLLLLFCFVLFVWGGGEDTKYLNLFPPSPVATLCLTRPETCTQTGSQETSHSTETVRVQEGFTVLSHIGFYI